MDDSLWVISCKLCLFFLTHFRSFWFRSSDSISPSLWFSESTYRVVQSIQLSPPEAINPFVTNDLAWPKEVALKRKRGPFLETLKIQRLESSGKLQSVLLCPPGPLIAVHTVQKGCKLCADVILVSISCLLYVVYRSTTSFSIYTVHISIHLTCS